MRRRFRKTRQVMAGLLSAVLLMTSMPQDGTYVYAAEQTQELASEETKDEQAESEAKETTHSSAEIETEDAEGSENAETENKEENFDFGIEETKEDKTDTQSTDGEETETEKTETEESIKLDGEDEEQETATEDEIGSQIEMETVELTGAYQFGGAPSPSTQTNGLRRAKALDSTDVQEYIYQQMLARSESIDISEYNIPKSQEALNCLVSGVLNEHPDLYFVSASGCMAWSNGTIYTKLTVTYDDTYDDDAFKKAVKTARATIKSGMSDLEKAIALHDYLVINCEYDKERLSQGSVPLVSHSAYGSLVNRISVCDGYALAYKYLLSLEGINCYMVTSEAMNHAWNLIELDEQFYQVDVTWDDPTWDRIGRAVHTYMFRSDNDFKRALSSSNQTHHDWNVTYGGEVVDYVADDTRYDSAFWLNSDAPLVLDGNDCYYVSSVGKSINVATLNDLADAGRPIVSDIGTWLSWEGDGYWPGIYSGLFQINRRLFYNDMEKIYSINLDGTEKTIEFTADITDGYIYGSAFCQGKVLYALHRSPNITSKETVLPADIAIEIEKPSEIPVEKIELDKETLTLAVGDTAILKAVVTPDDATNTDITWKSSDSSVAGVSDGTVTAVAAGSCTITASAGGKETVCEVTVTDGEEESSEIESSEEEESSSTEESSSIEESSEEESSSTQESYSTEESSE
ncbi:MAG: Ig-like domain-containing protein, partial [Lachnospiraceae bacterium]|nr:Ig-like domain-containing protein [Lachnospiraceae bacterium]